MSQKVKDVKDDVKKVVGNEKQSAPVSVDTEVNQTDSQKKGADKADVKSDVIEDLTEEDLKDGGGVSIHVEVPGQLKGESELIIETFAAQLAFKGRDRTKDKRPIIGLKAFAGTLRIVWQAADVGDPYADWWLLKAERTLEEKEQYIEGKIEEYKKVLNRYPKINHEIAYSIKPLKMTLRFAIPYSYRGAILVMKMDDLIRMIKTAQHVGVVKSQPAQNDIDKVIKEVRTAFMSVMGFRFTNVKRRDIYQMNQVAQRAAELMGPCPPLIVDDEIVPAFESGRARASRRIRNAERRDAKIRKAAEAAAADKKEMAK